MASALLSHPSVLSGFNFPFCLCPWNFSPSSDLVLDPDTCHDLGAALPTLVSSHTLVPLPVLAGDTKGRNYKLRLRQFTGNSKAIRERAVAATMLIRAVYRGDGVLQAECSLCVWPPWCDPRDNEPNGTWTLHAHVFLPHGSPCLLPEVRAPYFCLPATVGVVQDNHGGIPTWLQAQPHHGYWEKTNSVQAENQDNTET